MQPERLEPTLQPRTMAADSDGNGWHWLPTRPDGSEHAANFIAMPMKRRERLAHYPP